MTRDGHFLVRCQFYLFFKHFLVLGFFCAHAQAERGFYRLVIVKIDVRIINKAQDKE